MDNEEPVLTVEDLSGVEDGTVLPSAGDAPDERVVADYDENGNLVGWHKEVV